MSDQRDIYPLRLSCVVSNLVSGKNDIAPDVFFGGWAELVRGGSRDEMHGAVSVLVPGAHDHEVSRSGGPDPLETKSPDASIVIDIEEPLC